ncbi:MAG: DUF1566 domain-containing protein [Bacteroidetes bacterium]|nr:DUF1566 domain-containing protein [Bacteroidota bacterium]
MAIHGLSQTLRYTVVDAGQLKCYSSTGEMTCPTSGQPFFGQDAHYSIHPASYVLSADTKTVYDKNTGLTWMSSPNTNNTGPVKANRMTYSAAQTWVGTVNGLKYGGFSDWRIPTIKEIYSLYSSRGTDPSSFIGTDLSVLTPFIDTNYFKFKWGNTATGERLIDQQYASSTTFILNPSGSGYQKLFAVNFADGRIKGYDMTDALSGLPKTFYYQLVRGPLTYGINNFVDNGNQTITDSETRLMWSKNDNGKGLNWLDALTWVQTQNAANYLGYNDWRMPDVKELQSLVNYSNSPDYNSLPAIDVNYFVCSSITNENGQADFPYYWSASTHAPYNTNGNATEADYVAFGRAMGWPTTTGAWIDVHGAGAQRSDPKTTASFNPGAILHSVVFGGNTYTGYSWGPQGDAIRAANYVRLVRTVSNTSGLNKEFDYGKIMIKPNPFIHKIKIVGQTGLENYAITNALGEIIWTGINIEETDFSTLEPGLYFLRVKEPNSEFTIKLIKQ